MEPGSNFRKRRLSKSVPSEGTGSSTPQRSVTREVEDSQGEGTDDVLWAEYDSASADADGEHTVSAQKETVLPSESDEDDLPAAFGTKKSLPTAYPSRQDRQEKPATQYKYSLAALVKEKQASTARHSQFDKAEQASHDIVNSKEVLDEAVGENADALRDTLSRLDRTRAQHAWSFFSEEHVVSKTRTTFPAGVCDNSWLADVVDPSVRSFWFRGGFMLSTLSLGKVLPDELLMWLLDEIYYETREELVHAYVDYIVEAAKKHPNTFQNLLSADRFQRMLLNLGVSANTMGQGTKVDPALHNDIRCKSPVSSRSEGTLGCRAFLRLVSAFPYQPSESAAFVLVLDSVLKMGLDTSYTHELWQPAATSLTGLYDMAQTNEQRWKEMVPRIEAVASYISDHSLFQLRVLRLLPARSYAERTLRKRIALRMFLAQADEETEKVMIRSVSACLSHIRSSRPFHPLNSETDYIELGLRLQILDIAIESPEEAEIPAARILAEHLKLMHGRIIDSRAAFISRSEAKDVLQRIFLRLAYMVGKPVRGVRQATLDLGWTV